MPRLIAAEGKAPRVSDSAWLAPDVVLVGDVIVGDRATLMFGVVVRGDLERIEIGRGANLQDRVVVHADPGYPVTIGAESAVGHGAIIHGCRIGEGALVGMGAVVLNGARIGEGAVIGAAALVLQNVEIEAHALAVGLPARVVRPIEGAPGRETAGRYRALVARYDADEVLRNESSSSVKGAPTRGIE
jgi:carbonic anhydrase/acetyltransferase-like protein (isoleucine patch superfamily)